MIGPLSQESISRRILKFSLFDPAEYVGLHEDLVRAKVDGTKHYLQHGIWEEREFVSKATIARMLGSFQRQHAKGEEVEEVSAERAAGVDEIADILHGIAALPEIAIYVNSGGNFFMREIADQTARELASLGIEASVRDETSDIAQRPKVCIYVAPHEFFGIGSGSEWLRDEIICSGFMFSTEQLDTQWFRKSLPVVLGARAVIDLNLQTYLLYRDAGVPSFFYNPGFPDDVGWAYRDPPDHPLIKGLSVAARNYDLSNDFWIDRPIDVFFTGTSSPQREESLTSLSRTLAAFENCIHYVRMTGGPLVSDSKESRPAVSAYIARRSKIVLNLHRGDINYFEWHRMIMQGCWHRALVISEPCLYHPVFKPGIHYLEEEPRRMPQLIEWLIKTRDGRLTAERVRNEAFSNLVEQSTMQRSSVDLAGFILRHIQPDGAKPGVRNPVHRPA